MREILRVLCERVKKAKRTRTEELSYSVDEHCFGNVSNEWACFNKWSAPASTVGLMSHDRAHRFTSGGWVKEYPTWLAALHVHMIMVSVSIRSGTERNRFRSELKFCQCGHSNLLALDVLPWYHHALTLCGSNVDVKHIYQKLVRAFDDGVDAELRSSSQGEWK
jgi:hypothetical protein